MTNTNPTASKNSKIDLLNAAYQTFSKKMDELRLQRLEHLKKTFFRIDDKRILDIKEQINNQ